VGTQPQQNPVQRNPVQRNSVQRNPVQTDADPLIDDERVAESSPPDELVDMEIVEEPEDGSTDLAPHAEALAPLFPSDNAADYRARWDVVQRGFVDDPARAVRDGDALLSEVINALARTFADERASLEGELSRKNDASTELLRRALQRHRAFFERLLSF
jgi:hypothetical protein